MENHKHIAGGCLGGAHQFAWCHACNRQRCRNCGAEYAPQHNHPVPIRYVAVGGNFYHHDFPR